ncbi:MAG: outer membrane lipoprotein carrier protein LolA [Acidobacteria bacterium]|nr:outer membrane lipoprotein carrier protein LolA [Acidobacteriota bacterium]
MKPRRASITIGGTLILAAVSFASFSAQKPPQKVSAAEVLHLIESRSRAAKTLKATFLERYSEGRQDVRIESGTVSFSRPGRMRWEYEEPEKKLFLADGLHVWFYVPADRTVTRAKTKESSDWRTPLAMLAGKGSLARACRLVEWARITEIANEKHNVGTYSAFSIRCLPKENDQGFSEVVVDADSGYRPTRILIREPGGIETEFRFAAWQENVPLAESLFHFSAPQGVAIVEEKLPGLTQKPSN